MTAIARALSRTLLKGSQPIEWDTFSRSRQHGISAIYDQFAAKLLLSAIEPVEPLVTDASNHLHRTYAGLAGTWQTWLSDKTLGQNCPAVRWMANVPDDAPVTSREVLLKGIELTVSQTGLAIRDHLDSLSSIYPTRASRQADPKTSAWPGSSAFTLARSVLEGTAMITWLLDDRTDDEERARRSARVILWSAHFGTKWVNATGNAHAQVATPDHWKRIIEDAGLLVTRPQNQLVVDKAFSQTEVISSAFNTWGKNLYNRWSGEAHHAPWVLTPATYLRPAEGGGGHHMGMDSRLADHLDAAADVSDLLLVSSQAIRTYWGRVNVDPQRDEIETEATQLRVDSTRIRSKNGFQPD